MNNAIFNFNEPKNEPVLTYISGSQERKLLEEELILQSNQVIDIALIIGGKEVRTGKIVMPSNHNHVLAAYHFATEKEVNLAINAALEAKNEWMTLAWMERAAINLKQLRNEKKVTVILATHSVVPDNIADRVLTIENGCIKN